MISMMTLGIALLSIIWILFIFFFMNIGLKKERNIHKYGIETNAIILKNEIRGCRTEQFKCSYVAYIDVDGLKHEAILNKCPNLPIDSKIKIKYLPDDYKHVVFISQVI